MLLQQASGFLISCSNILPCIIHRGNNEDDNFLSFFCSHVFRSFFLSLDPMKGRTFIWSLWHDLLSLSLLCILSSLSNCIHLLPRKRCIVLRNETKVYIEDFRSSTVQRVAFYTPLIKNSSHTVCKIQDSDSLQYSQLYLLIVGRQSEGKIIILSVCEKRHIGELKFFPGRRRVDLVYSLIIYKMKLKDKRKWFRLPDRVFVLQNKVIDKEVTFLIIKTNRLRNFKFKNFSIREFRDLRYMPTIYIYEITNTIGCFLKVNHGRIFVL